MYEKGDPSTDKRGRLDRMLEAKKAGDESVHRAWHVHCIVESTMWTMPSQLRPDCGIAWSQESATGSGAAK